MCNILVQAVLSSHNFGGWLDQLRTGSWLKLSQYRTIGGRRNSGNLVKG